MRDWPISARLLLLIKLSLGFLGVVAGLAWLWGVNAARYLRPSADDYCIGVRGDLGILGGFIDDWQTFSGFATPSFVTNAFLGVPLAHLPLSLSLAIPFLLAASAVAAAGLSLLYSSFMPVGFKRSWRWIAIGVPALMVLWWAHLWSAYSPSGRPTPTSVALGLTHWQNLNTGYVIPIAIVVLLGVWVIRRDFSSWIWASGSAFLLGLLAGFAGPATALSVLVFIPFVAAGMWALGHQRWLLKTLVVWFTAAIALAISLTSPGTLNRATLARSDAEVSIGSIPGWFLAVVPDAFIAWFNLYWQWRSFVVLAVGMLITLGIRTLWRGTPRIQAGLPWLAVTLFALSLSATTIVTDLLAYGAYWHQSNTTVLTFLSLLLLGTGIGGWLPMPLPRLALVALPVLLIALAFALFASIMDMSVSITDRHAAWEVGPAPIVGVIEDREVDWIMGCWESLREIRSRT